MPMLATPFEQFEVAVATKFTGEVTVAPLLGLITVTVANTGVAKTPISRVRKYFFISTLSSVRTVFCERLFAKLEDTEAPSNHALS